MIDINNMNFKQFLSICIFTAGFIYDIVNGRPNIHSAKIVNGTPTTIEAHPYQVQVERYKNGYSSHCGGSILNRNTIITAAHCVNKRSPNSIFVRVGTTNRNRGGIINKVIKILVHDDYKVIHGMPYNDIALLKLEKKLEFNHKTQPVHLPSRTGPIPAGKFAKSTGWGLTNEKDLSSQPDILQEITIRTLSNEKCKEKYSGTSYEITDDILCAFAEGKSICRGDSGGPLAVNKILIGVASATMSCADPFYPAIYANVSHFNDLIKRNL